ncbi:hypothetical protein PI124_g19018 [Phytophthora idaei]|nr:hypothetical protein PI125_g19361 [Phytophthora idaei]KAG3136371.1 hypothetical protein PI126_g17853 [Phytophthora idaei]KAG3235960.1 hypothetical protein PI124_g19018 [Phytophthora idaei]
MEAALSFIDEFAGELSVEVPSLTDSTTSASSTVSLEELLAPDDEEEASLLPLSDSPVPVDTLVNENLQLNERQLTPCPTPTKKARTFRPRQKKRQGAYNPNYAREQQRKELCALRTEAADLEAQLAAIQQVRGAVVVQDENISSQNKRSPFADIARSVWMAAAQQQVLEHMKAAIENRRLEALVETNADVLSKLQALLQQCSLDKTARLMHPEAVEYLRAYDAEILTQATLDQLIASTDQSYQQGTSSHEFLVRKYSHVPSSKQGELFGTSPRSVSVPLRDATSTIFCIRPLIPSWKAVEQNFILTIRRL